ncbi:MAG: helix-turn-helix transcriptional regulator [Verrucomicrobiota bacterium]
MKMQTDKLLRRLGQNIRRQRNAANLTQAALSANARISATHLSAIERGERSASVLCLARIAKALQTTTEKLCEGIEDRTRQK